MSKRIQDVEAGDRVGNGQGVEFVVGLADYDRHGNFWVAGFDDGGAFRYGVFSDSWKLVTPDVMRWLPLFDDGAEEVRWYLSVEEAFDAAFAGEADFLIEHNVTKGTATLVPVVRS